MTSLLNCYVITVLMLIVETMFQGLSEREEAYVSICRDQRTVLEDEAEKTYITV